MGYIVYEGPSALVPGVDVVVAITGVDTPSHNPKTGPMVQTWVLVADTPPHDAVRSGRDAAVCGGCQHRGRGDGTARSCYVVVHHAPLTIWRAIRAGAYPRVPLDAVPALGRGRLVRLGAYGDPAAVPVAVWDALLQDAAGWTGYTHQWASPRLRAVTKYCAASCDSPEQAAQALRLGLPTFRVTGPEEPLLPGEALCPAGTSANRLRGNYVTCAQCLQCQGTLHSAEIVAQQPLTQIAVRVHGVGARHFPQPSTKTHASSVNLIVPSGHFGNTTGVDEGCKYENHVLTTV